ncbi:hypothetical protein RB195_015543 [Necator americanus]|uniref:DB module n=1 Tax=Necator americanus TaxID=51031 RepID=A0ABR1E526_NECAM
MSRTVLFFIVIAVYGIDARHRRQFSDEEQSDLSVSGWDPTIRDRFESCHSIASFAPTSEQYCKAFTMCCSMQFDPNNGDKCQTNEQRCIPLEQGGADAVCIQRRANEYSQLHNLRWRDDTIAMVLAISKILHKIDQSYCHPRQRP